MSLPKHRARRNQQAAAAQPIHDHQQRRIRWLGSPRAERKPRPGSPLNASVGRRESLTWQRWHLQIRRPVRSLVVARRCVGSAARGQCQEMRFDRPDGPFLRGQIQHPRMPEPPAIPTRPPHRADDRNGSSMRSPPHAGGPHQTLSGMPDTPLRHFRECRWREQSIGRGVPAAPLLRAR